MESMHANIFEYQHEWLANHPEINSSQLVRQLLTPLVPSEEIPDSFDTSASIRPETPILGHGAGDGFAKYEKRRVHLSLHDWQHDWAQQEPIFSFTVFVRGQIDARMPTEVIPPERRASLKEIGIIGTPDEWASDQQPTEQSNPSDS